MWIQTLTLLVDQGLWIQVSVLHLSCAKAASSDIRARFIAEELHDCGSIESRSLRDRAAIMDLSPWNHLHDH